MHKFLKLAALAAMALTCAAQTDWTTQVQNKPFADVREYRFTRTNGKGATGDLSSAGANTVTVTPCPKGVAGANTNHYVRISGGVGAAEAVVITGGTCTSGAATGTLGFTTANAHTGAWTVTSATSGIQEALNAAPTKRIVIPAGNHQIFAEIYIGTGATIEGEGPAYTTVTANDLTQNVFHIQSLERVDIRGIQITSGLPKTGGAGVLIDGVLNRYSTITGCYIVNQHIGVQSETGHGFTIENNYIVNTVLHGISVRNHLSPDTGDSAIINNIFDTIGEGAAIFQASSGGLRILGNKILHHSYGVDLLLDDGVHTSNLIIQGNSIEGFTDTGVRLRKAGDGTFSHVLIIGNQIKASAAASHTVHVGAGINEVIISGNHFQAKGVLLGSDRIVFSDNIMNTATLGVDPTGGTNLTATHNQFWGVTTRYGASANGLMVYDTFIPINFANLVPLRPGSMIYCSDCTIANPCAGGGNGAIAKRLNGAWVCN